MRNVAVGLLVGMFLSFWTYGQDTTCVYFDFGKSKVKKTYRQRLLGLHDRYDLSSVDSIQFVGYADSVGKSQSNMKLARKRAESAWEVAKNVLPEEIPFSIVSRGEDKNSVDSVNRRVEVILFYPRKIEEVEVTADTLNPKCFFVATDLIVQCNVRVITRRKKEYVQLITPSDTSFSNRTFYYARVSKEGATEYKKLRWKEKKIGDDWWRKNRLVAEVPRKECLNYGIFEMQEAPCSGCKETIITKDTAIVWVQKFYPNAFLSQVMQVKDHRPGKTRIRVPAEFVDASEDYFVGTCAYCDENEVVEWYEKRSKRKKKYRYAKIDFPQNTEFYLKQSYVTTECRNRYLDSMDSTSWRVKCGGVWNLSTWRFQGGYWSLEAGGCAQNLRPTGYVGIGYNYVFGRWNFGVLAAMEHRIGFYGLAYANYKLLLHPVIEHRVNHCILGNQRSYHLKYVYVLYTGTNLQVNTTFQGTGFLQSGVYLGGAILPNGQIRGLDEVYLQAGVGYDYSHNISGSPFGYAQLGVRFRILNRFSSLKIRYLN